MTSTRTNGEKVFFNNISKDLGHQMSYKHIESGIESMQEGNMDINQGFIQRQCLANQTAAIRELQEALKSGCISDFAESHIRRAIMFLKMNK